MRRRIVTAVVIAALILGGFLIVRQKQRQLATLPLPAGQPRTVQTAAVAEGSLEVTSRQLGEVQPYTSADLAPRITGHILSLTKREGDAVAQGETVCVVDDRELADRAAAAEAEVLATRQRLAGARSLYEMQRSVTARDEKLFAAGAISQEALERSRAALDGARAAAEAFEESLKGLERGAAAARLQTGYARVAAPFSGVVTRRLAEPGDLAVPGKPVVTIEQTSPVKVVVQVPQELMGKVRSGSKLYLVNDGERLTVEVARVYPALAKNLLGSVEVVLPESPFGLPTGSTLGAELVTATVAGSIVPESALVRSQKGCSLCLVENGTVRVRPVELLGTGGGKAAVRGDLPAGATVAVGQENRLLTLADGMAVTTGGAP